MTTPIFEAVLFDMDGVIIDTHAQVTRFWLRLAERSHVTLTDDDFVQHIHGRKAEHTLGQFFPDVTDAMWAEAMADLEAEEAVTQYTPIPGVTRLVRALKEAGVPVALVTSAEPSKPAIVLPQLQIDDCFVAQVTAFDVDRGKPYPDCYRLGAQRVGKAPERCLVFEDSLSGAEAALRAGTTCVGVNHSPDALMQLGTAHVIPDFTQARVETTPTGPVLHLAANYTIQFALS